MCYCLKSLFVWLCLLEAIVSAQQKANSEYQSNTQRWEKLFNAHAATELAAEYAEDCDVVNAGKTIERLSSRQAMEKAFSVTFAENPQVKILLSEVTYRPLSDDLVIESGLFNQIDGNPAEPNLRSMYATTYEKHGGRWQIVHERTWLLHAAELKTPQKDPLNSSQQQAFLEGQPKHVQEYFADLIGDWTMSGRMGEESFEAKFSFAWSTSGGCVTWTASWRGPTDSQLGTSSGTGIVGWDPKNEEVIEQSFWSDGDGGAWRAKFDSAGNLTGKFDGLSDQGTKTATGHVTQLRNQPNRFTWTLSERKLAAEAQPDLQLVFSRDK